MSKELQLMKALEGGRKCSQLLQRLPSASALSCHHGGPGARGTQPETTVHLLLGPNRKSMWGYDT